MKLIVLLFLITGCSFLIPKEKEDTKQDIHKTEVEESNNTSITYPVSETKTELSLKEVCIKGIVHYYTSSCDLIPKFKQDGSLWECK